MSKLYLIPTPIGNLEDITFRALRLLKEVDIVLAEDTRTTKKLFSHYEIDTQLAAFHMHNEHKVLGKWIARLKGGETIALVSDAGTPGISDPGFLLIRECITKGIDIECLPGPAAVIPAIVGSGFPCDRFVFEGFLPHKKGRQTRLLAIAEEVRTTVLYESPHRLVKCLGQIEEFMGKDRQICVARELTKLYEEFRRGSASEVKAYYEAHPPKGEIVIIIEGVQTKKVKNEKTV